MAKGQKRSNREVRKPKAEKKKAAPPASPFPTAQLTSQSRTKPAQGSPAAKK